MLVVNQTPSFQLLTEPVMTNLQSQLTADYKIGEERANIPALRMEIIQEILKDQGNLSKEEIESRLSEVEVLLSYPFQLQIQLFQLIHHYSLQPKILQ